MSKRKLEEEFIWLPDFNKVVDWRELWDLSQKSYTDDPSATWWLQATPGVNYVRGELPARALPGKTVQLEVRDLYEDEHGRFHFPRQGGDTAIWLFSGNVTRALLMSEMKNVGYRVLMEVDDNYTVHPPTRSENWLSKRDETGQDRSSFEVHRKITERIVDGVICSTPKLAQVYSRMNPNVYVCPNSVAPEDWPAEPEHAPDGILRIGWAGSTSHMYDLNDIVPALDWASRQPDVEIVLMGGIDIPRVPHRQIPWADSLEEFRNVLQNIDVMLCPLREGSYHDCKSDVKALEAAMSGAVPVVSEVEAYRPWWEEGAPCLSAKRSKDFTKAVKHLVANRDETERLARAARAWVLGNRTIEHNIGAWRDAIAG